MPTISKTQRKKGGREGEREEGRRGRGRKEGRSMFGSPASLEKKNKSQNTMMICRFRGSEDDLPPRLDT